MTENQNIEETAGEPITHLQQPFVEQSSPNEKEPPVPTEQPTTPNQPGEITVNQNITDQNTMEVHHPHHLTHKKKWSEYLLEFAMLFLAVFLGFMAENWREHLIERHREEVFVQSLREDMAKDTAILQTGIGLLTKYSSAGDSLATMIQQGRVRSGEEIKKLYQYNITALAGFFIPLTDRTEAQLKNSGGMRLITNKKVSDAIVDYWKGSEELNIFFQDVHEYRMKARERSYLIFDNKYYIQVASEERPMQEGAQLMTNDKNTLIEFGNRVVHIKNLSLLYISYLNKQKAKADSLMAVIDEEY